MTGMSNIDAWQWIVAFVTPYIVGLVNRPTMSANAKRFTMVGVAIVIAAVTQFLAGGFEGFTLGAVLVYLVAFIGVVQAAYATLKATAPKSLDAAEGALVKGEVTSRRDEPTTPPEPGSVQGVVNEALNQPYAGSSKRDATYHDGEDPKLF